MRPDIDIAREAAPRPIADIAAGLGLKADELHAYGPYMAKVPLGVMERLAERPDGRLILVTAMTPTKHGEGKTTTTIGLTQALARLGKRAMAAIREPSLGPCMGLKGGAAGGGYSQVLPMEEINLHFTGDLHAVTAAHNLLAALVDNHLHQGNMPEIHPRKVLWKRVIDMNDRSLRSILLGLEGAGANGVMREDGFEITAASEIMAIWGLSSDLMDLKARMGRVLVGFDGLGRPIHATELGVQGAMAALMKNAMHPNLVQTIEGVPALVHGGPFANIAHGCNTQRLWGNWGAALFADTGAVSDQNFPGSGDWSVGVGAGLRYHTPVGPVRIDLATPLNNDAGDSSLQIYIGIGQAY